MKYNRKFILIPLVLFIITITQIMGIPQAEASTIRLSSSKSSLSVNSTKRLTVLGTRKKVSWGSGNRSVATVSSKGLVTAKGPGTATIYASVNGKKLYCRITVLKIS